MLFFTTWCEGLRGSWPCLSSHAQPLWPRGLWPARLLCPWNFPGRNTGVSCHFLLQVNLPDPRIEPTSPASPALAGRLFTTEPLGNPHGIVVGVVNFYNGSNSTKCADTGDVGSYLGWEDPLEKGNGNPQYSCPENSMDRGAWPAKVHRVAKSQTGLSTHAILLHAV